MNLSQTGMRAINVFVLCEIGINQEKNVSEKMATEPKVKSIKIEIDGCETDVSVDYALKLYRALDGLFKSKTYPEPTNPQC
jgi:hypothetical protein